MNQPEPFFSHFDLFMIGFLCGVLMMGTGLIIATRLIP